MVGPCRHATGKPKQVANPSSRLSSQAQGQCSVSRGERPANVVSIRVMLLSFNWTAGALVPDRAGQWVLRKMPAGDNGTNGVRPVALVPLEDRMVSVVTDAE